MRITIINIYNRAPKYMKQKLTGMETSLVVQWLGLCTFTAVSLGSIPGQGTKIPQVVWRGPKNKTNKQTNKKQKKKGWRDFC